METLVTVVHYFVCLFLLVVILLQAGKGADIGAAFGAGSSQTLFGPRGAATFLNKLTGVIAVVFLGTSLILVSMTKRESSHSVFEKVPASSETAPAEPPPVTNPQE